MSFYVFAQRAGVCVALITVVIAAGIRLLDLMGANMLKSITRVGVGFVAAFHRANVGFLTCSEKNT